MLEVVSVDGTFLQDSSVSGRPSSARRPPLTELNNSMILDAWNQRMPLKP
jgi:hypothetical protein